MRGHDEQGFTLLEVLVAFAILALVLGAVLRVLADGLGVASAADRMIAATGVARSRIAEVGTVRPLAAGQWTGATPEGYRWQVAIAPASAPPLPFARGPFVSGPVVSGRARPALVPYDVVVTVAWNDAWRERSIVFATVRLGAGT
ncbi:type IV pilus modification PilV family protein [Azospirillum canadense]|uniref:type IV pilus modification PilV family protein n=1 Tax=Azospirillum canadense TaxID=403962 RepID=UPI002227D50A|nr:prepilin-type N-terminal cleavage/methylation domain-containing protein [Azospirillum canadense]MCW2239556.1 general secretion pathway protein I [Azospirillum canadense]